MADGAPVDDQPIHFAKATEEDLLDVAMTIAKRGGNFLELIVKLGVVQTQNAIDDALGARMILVRESRRIIGLERPDDGT